MASIPAPAPVAPCAAPGPDAAGSRRSNVKPVIKDGWLHLPTGPGWGTEVNEDAVRAHPPKKR